MVTAAAALGSVRAGTPDAVKGQTPVVPVRFVQMQRLTGAIQWRFVADVSVRNSERFTVTVLPWKGPNVYRVVNEGSLSERVITAVSRELLIIGA
jgi:hypothetical protein